MATATVRINPGTRDKLRDLSEADGETMAVVLDKAIEAYRRIRFLQEANTAYQALRDDPKAWKAEQAEREQWDGTLGDDLEKE